MRQEIVILRSLEPEVQDPKGIPLGKSSTTGRRVLRLDSVVEDYREINSIRQEQDVLSAAVEIPLRMISPKQIRVQTEQNGERQWGLSALEVDLSECSGIGANVAVLDTGIDRAHEAFAHIDEDRLVEADFTGEGNGDLDGHGTHCAGTVFGGYVGEVPIGVAPNVSKAIVGKVIGKDGGSTKTLAQAIDWAIDEGANVVSMSVGFDFPALVKYLTSRDGLPLNVATSLALEAYTDNVELFSAIAKRSNYAGRPILFAAAAGNSSNYNENPNHIIGAEPPASAIGFLSVGALEKLKNNKLQLANFTNSRSRICAPGVDIVSARAGTTSGLVSMSGTSMATPHVAGAAALWLESLSSTHSDKLTNQLFNDAIIRSGKLEKIALDRIWDAGNGIVTVPRN